MGLKRLQAGVSAGQPATAQAAADILKSGGNAFDAAIAAFYAACAAEPVLASPGGGGYLLAHPAGGSPVLYDFFVQSPHEKCIKGLDFRALNVYFGTGLTQEFHLGHGSVATPGALFGMLEVHKDLGSFPLPVLLEPARALAHGGIKVNITMERLLHVVRDLYLYTPESRAIFESRQIPNLPLQQGEYLRMPGYARFLEELSNKGELFIRKDYSHLLARLSQEKGGHLTEVDLQNYRVLKRTPLCRHINGADIYTNPFPSLGGALALLGLSVLEKQGTYPEHGSLEHARIISDVLCRLSCEKGNRELLRSFSEEGVMDPDFLGRLQESLDQGSLSRTGTTHISIIDPSGNAVAMTLSNGSGSGIMDPTGAFMLNNILGEEDLNPKGFHQWVPNERISSMMAPTIVKHTDGSTTVTGTGGSNRIRSVILQVIYNRLMLHTSIEDAVRLPRLHCEQGVLSVEQSYPKETIQALESQLKKVNWLSKFNLFFGGANSMELNSDGDISGIGDHRRGGNCILL